jgi:hypothetical protein
MPKPPAAQLMDYEALRKQAPACNGTRGVSDFLLHELPSCWQRIYEANCVHRPNLVRYEFPSFLYLFDYYSALEIAGEVGFNQSVQDRVVAVIGRSTPQHSPRRGRRRLWAPPPEEIAGADRDQGHFIAHAIGGGLEVNLFSQSRQLNQGRSAAGKLYRQMERYCLTHAGTLCFARPLYTDGSSLPGWLEFGLLRDNATLWIETFEN